MGNRTTTLNLEHLFADDMPPVNKDTALLFRLTHNGRRIRLYARHDHVSFLDADQTDTKWPVDRTFDMEPRTHLRDFEVIDPFTKQEQRIARWAGIAIIIVEALDMCLKVFYKGDRDNPQVTLKWNAWNHSQEAQQVLAEALGLGYDVLILRGADMVPERLCEEKTAADEEATVIIPGLGIDPALGEKAKEEDEGEEKGEEEEGNEEDSKTRPKRIKTHTAYLYCVASNSFHCSSLKARRGSHVSSSGP